MQVLPGALESKLSNKLINHFYTKATGKTKSYWRFSLKSKFPIEKHINGDPYNIRITEVRTSIPKTEESHFYSCSKFELLTPTRLLPNQNHFLFKMSSWARLPMTSLILFSKLWYHITHFDWFCAISFKSGFAIFGTEEEFLPRNWWYIVCIKALRLSKQCCFC